MKADAPRRYTNEHTLVEKKARSNLAHADLRRRAKDRAAYLRRELRKSIQLLLPAWPATRKLRGDIEESTFVSSIGTPSASSTAELHLAQP